MPSLSFNNSLSLCREKEESKYQIKITGDKLSFLKKYFFSNCWCTEKLNGKYRNVPYNLCPDTHRASPIINIPHQSGTFVTMNEPTLKYHYHPEPIDYIRVRSQFCTFGVFEQMPKDMYPPLQCHTQQFYCPKNPMCSTYS